MEATSIPHLRRIGDVTQLYVDNKPFLALGGELGNSTASDLDVLESAFARCQSMGLNTVMLPVYWDRIEPEEGKFDFSLLQGALDRARHHGLHLVYLWFGTWKNSMSCYAPGWVKRDTARFERAKQSSGETMEIISPESAAANEADARAFAALLHWTKWTLRRQSRKNLSSWPRSKNEVGMIPEPRDHSESSEKAYKTNVPSMLMSLAEQGKLEPEVGALWEKAGRKTTGTWSDVFGPGPQGDEVFSAWQFANYVEKVAAAGKEGISAADVCQCRPDSSGISARPISQRPRRYRIFLEIWRAGAAVAGYDLSRHLFPQLHRVVRQICPQWESALHSRNGGIGAGARQCCVCRGTI